MLPCIHFYTLTDIPAEFITVDNSTHQYSVTITKTTNMVNEVPVFCSETPQYFSSLLYKNYIQRISPLFQ